MHRICKKVPTNNFYINVLGFVYIYWNFHLYYIGYIAYSTYIYTYITTHMHDCMYLSLTSTLLVLPFSFTDLLSSKRPTTL